MNNEGPFVTDYLCEVQKVYPNAGLGDVEIDPEKYPHIQAHKQELVEMFNEIYCWREIGGETVGRFQWIINKRFTEVQRKFEYAFTIIENNDPTKLGLSEQETYVGTSGYENDNESSGTSEQHGTDGDTTKVNDTPIQSLVETGNYASQITETSGSDENNSSRHDESHSEGNSQSHGTRDHTKFDKQVVEYIRDGVSSWYDAKMEFIEQFKDCFINILTVW